MSGVKKYVDKSSHQTIKRNAPKCLTNFIWSINGVKEAWRVLQNKNFETINLKCLNQDILENFFSQIRNFCGCNTNPNPQQFRDAFKALLVSNLTSKHSVGANCKEDTNGQTLALLQLIQFTEVAHDNDSQEAQEQVETEKLNIPTPTITNLTIPANKIIAIVTNKQVIKDSATCYNNVNNIELCKFIEHATTKLEINFPKICCDVKITEKIQDILREEENVLLLQCSHLKTTFFEVVAKEFLLS